MLVNKYLPLSASLDLAASLEGKGSDLFLGEASFDSRRGTDYPSWGSS
jgi:hypothetical protein